VAGEGSAAAAVAAEEGRRVVQGLEGRGEWGREERGVDEDQVAAS
jgi:hypothetical protein